MLRGNESRGRGPGTESGIEIKTSFPEAQDTIRNNNGRHFWTSTPLGVQRTPSQLLLTPGTQKEVTGSGARPEPRCLQEADSRFKSGLPGSRAHTPPMIPASLTGQVPCGDRQGPPPWGFSLPSSFFFWVAPFLFNYFRLLRVQGKGNMPHSEMITMNSQYILFAPKT